MAAAGGHSCQIVPDPAYAERLVPKLKLLWQAHVLPELLTRKIEQGKVAQSVPKTDDHHCSCGGVDKLPCLDVMMTSALTNGIIGNVLA